MATLLLHVDHTLMNTQSLFFLLGSFHPLETLELAEKEFRIQPSTIHTPEGVSFLKAMERAYRRFVKKVAAKEVSNDPLCLFRPRTMEWLRKVYQKKQEGIIKEIFLYTRSSYQRYCQFAKDVIHTCLDITDDNDTLIKGVMDGTCNPFYEEKEDVYWIHHDQMEKNQMQEDQKEKSENRIYVPFYDFVASFDRLAELYFSSLREEKISQDDVEEIVRWLYSPKGLKNKRDKINVTSVYYFLEERTGPTASSTSLPRQDDGWRTGKRWLEKLDRKKKWREMYPTWEKE